MKRNSRNNKLLGSIHKGEWDLDELRTEEEADMEFDEAYREVIRKRNQHLHPIFNNLLTPYLK